MLFISHSLPSNPKIEIEQIYNYLKPDGKVLFEQMYLAKHYCFPTNSVFDRYLTLYTQATHSNEVQSIMGPEFEMLLESFGFQQVKSQVTPPIFLHGEDKRMASLTLEHIAPILFDQKLIRPTELKNLLSELRAFEAQQHSTITLPGIYQVWGNRD